MCTSRIPARALLSLKRSHGMDVWFRAFFCINWLAYTERAGRDRPVTALTRAGPQHGRQAQRPINKNIFQLVLGRCLCNTFSIRAWNVRNGICGSSLSAAPSGGLPAGRRFLLVSKPVKRWWLRLDWHRLCGLRPIKAQRPHDHLQEH